MNSLIPPDHAWALWSFIVAGVAVCIWLEQTRAWAAKTSGPVLALLAGMALSNTGIAPVDAPVYDVVEGYLVPVAIPLLLFQANVRRILGETGPMFRAFHVAALGTFVGAFLAALIFRGAVERLPEVIGVMTGSYIGGGVNFVALKGIYDVPATLTNPLLVADNFIMAGMFAVLLVIAGSRFFLQRYPHPHTLAGNAADARTLAEKHWRRKEIALLDIARAIAVAVVVAALSKQAAAWATGAVESRLWQSLVGSPYVWMTVLTVGLATFARAQVERIHGAEELGMYLLYLFFFVIGLRADFWQVLFNTPVLFGVCLVMAAANLAVTLLLGKLLRMNLEELLLSVNATLGGAPSAAAMAISKGWQGLVLPGFLAGVWGYVIGTFCGVLAAEAIRSLF